MYARRPREARGNALAGLIGLGHDRAGVAPGAADAAGPVAIPVVDAPNGPLQVATARAAQLPAIVARVRELVPRAVLRAGDAYAARTFRNAGNPHMREIDAIARLLGQPGAYALNFCFELGCTTACRSPDGAGAMRLFRTLDWPFRLGRDVVLARHAPAAGPYVNIPWPGYVGVLTAMAPGRFAAAINQPPMEFSFESVSLGLAIDWMVNRWRMRGTQALPPAHLLRLAFETCGSYAEAKVLLTTTPICTPAIYTLTGVGPEEGCIIERRARHAVMHEGPACVTNHWLNRGFRGRPRARNSQKRLGAMQAALPGLGAGGVFDWLTPPVLNPLTRMAAELCAETGRVVVQGWHGPVPQTEVLEVGCDGVGWATPQRCGACRDQA
jgi:hypothetical protein